MTLVKPFTFATSKDLQKRRFPTHSKSFKNFRTACEELVLAGFEPESAFISPDSKIVTLGSCFATHIAEHLAAKQFDVSHYFFSERLFTTHALRYFIDAVATGQMPDNLIQFKEDILKKEDMLAMQRKFREGCTVIVTLGMAMSWYHSETDQMYYYYPSDGQHFNDYEMRLTSIEDNAANLTAIIASLQALNPANRIIFTVSPIPLLFAKCDHPIMVADYLSKSTLRMAIEHLSRDDYTGVYYYPSFEIVRWAAPFVGRVWGLDDDDPRHVSRQLVEMVMHIFSMHYMTDTKPPATPKAVVAATETV